MWSLSTLFLATMKIIPTVQRPVDAVNVAGAGEGNSPLIYVLLS